MPKRPPSSSASRSSSAASSQEVIAGVHRSVLPNGLRVLCETVPGAHSFALGIWVDVGARDESAEQSGIAHFIEHMVFRGSETRSSSQIASSFESLGAYVNAFTAKEQTCYYVRALPAHFDRCLDVLSDVVLHPLFRAKDVSKERTVILEELKSYDDEAEELIQDMAERALFGSHSLGFPIAGTIDSVAKLGVGDLQRFHRQHYRSDAMVIAVAGAVDHEHVLQSVQKLFRAKRPSQSRPRRASARRVQRKILTTERAFSQSHLLMARRTNGVRHADRWALALLNTIVGDGMSSRLHQRIRERTGAAYALYSSLQLMTDSGVFSIYAGTEHARLQKTETLIDRELTLLHSDGVKKSELARAKEQLKSSMIMGLESMSARMNSLAKAELEELHFEDLETSLRAIDAVSLEEMNALCRSLCQVDDWTRVRIHGTGDAHSAELPLSGEQR